MPSDKAARLGFLDPRIEYTGFDGTLRPRKAVSHGWAHSTSKLDMMGDDLLLFKLQIVHRITLLFCPFGFCCVVLASVAFGIGCIAAGRSDDAGGVVSRII